MNLSPELIIAFTGLAIGVLGWVDKFYSRWTATHQAGRRADVAVKKIELANRRDELALLRDELEQQKQRYDREIARLTERLGLVEQQNSALHEQVICLERERSWLQFTLAQAGIAVLPMPEDWK